MLHSLRSIRTLRSSKQEAVSSLQFCSQNNRSFDKFRLLEGNTLFEILYVTSSWLTRFYESTFFSIIQVVKILTVCPGENVLIRTKWTFSHFVRGKACFYGQIVWIGRFCPCKGRNRIPDSLWGMFEFSDSLARKTIPKRGRGYPTRELGWKPQMFWSKCRILGISNETVGLEGIESLFFVPPKTFSQNKTAVSDAFSTI